MFVLLNGKISVEEGCPDGGINFPAGSRLMCSVSIMGKDLASRLCVELALHRIILVMTPGISSTDRSSFDNST